MQSVIKSEYPSCILFSHLLPTHSNQHNFLIKTWTVIRITAYQPTNSNEVTVTYRAIALWHTSTESTKGGNLGYWDSAGEAITERPTVTQELSATTSSRGSNPRKANITLEFFATTSNGKQLDKRIKTGYRCDNNNTFPALL